MNQAYKDYLRSDHWQKLRAAAIRYYAKRCALTGERLSLAEINVHHLAYSQDGCEGTVVQDLCLLSRRAHLLVHDYKRRGLIEAFNWNGIQRARQLYASGVGDPALMREIRVALKRKGDRQDVIYARRRMARGLMPLPGKKKNPRRNKNGSRSFGRPRRFAPPRVKWSSMTEAERHALALRRQEFTHSR